VKKLSLPIIRNDKQRSVHHSGEHGQCSHAAKTEDSKGYTSLEVISGDAGFISRNNCTAIETLGAVPRLFPERGITFRRAFPLPLRRRLRWRRNTEAFTRACCHNLKRLCYLRYLFGIEPTFSFQLGC